MKIIILRILCNRHYNATVKEILPETIKIQIPEGELSIPNDFVLALTGYKPNFEFLQKIGIQLSEDKKLRPQYTEETMETNIKNLYFAGVICGGMDTHLWFIENSRIHAKKILKSISKKHFN